MGAVSTSRRLGEVVAPAQSAPVAVDPLLGTLVDGRYQILDVLGEGTLGRVYKVRHELFGRLFALKALGPEPARDEALGARFIEEAKATARVRHPNVIQITDTGSLGSGRVYFVMELLTGPSLDRLLGSQGPLAARDATHIAHEVAVALAAAHRVGVIHGDLKPRNIQLEPGRARRPKVKVLDFGLPKITGAGPMGAGMWFGTPQYMSPEQARGAALDRRIDVYALGVLLFEMLTGRVPFDADTCMGVLTQHLYVDPPRPSVAAGHDGVGPLDDVVLRCLAKNPDDRFASMDVVCSELARAGRAVCRARAARVAAASDEPRAAPRSTERCRTNGETAGRAWTKALGGQRASRRAPGSAPASSRRLRPWALGAVGLVGLCAASIELSGGHSTPGTSPGGRLIGPATVQAPHPACGGSSPAAGPVLAPPTFGSVASRADAASRREEPGLSTSRQRAGPTPSRTNGVRSSSEGRVPHAAVASQRHSTVSNGEIIDPWAPPTEP